MSINALKVVLHYQPELAQQIEEKRKAGATIDVVTQWLCAETGQKIGRESVRSYLKEAEAVP